MFRLLRIQIYVYGCKKAEILWRLYETWPSSPASFAVFLLTVKSKSVELIHYRHHPTLFVTNTHENFTENLEILVDKP